MLPVELKKFNYYTMKSLSRLPLETDLGDAELSIDSGTIRGSAYQQERWALKNQLESSFSKRAKETNYLRDTFSPGAETMRTITLGPLHN